MGLLLSAVLHGAALGALWLAADAGRFKMVENRRVDHIAGPHDPGSGAPGKSAPAGTARSAAATPAKSRPYDAPLDWLRPAFAATAFGRPIDIRSGRILHVDKKAAPDLKKPRLRPYLPPTVADRQPDSDHDVLNRTRPVTYTRAALEREAQALKNDIAADLEDCRLDEIPLDVVILRSRYLRLRKLLFEKGLEPDFSYSDMRNHFLEKMYRIRRSLDGVPADQYFPTLLFEYRKDKIYEEKRGHSLFNSIFYDLYNCRTGTEELAMYFSLFHPEMALGFNRGSIIKFDGTLIGHVDPVVRMNGQWTVFKTVSREADAVVPYAIGELFPIEKLILDYLPGFDASACRLNRPLARNGEELDDRLQPPKRQPPSAHRQT